MAKTLSTIEAAERLDITPQAVRLRIQVGTLRAERVGRDWRIRPADVERARVSDTAREAADA